MIEIIVQDSDDLVIKMAPVIDLLENSVINNGKILVCGNGGSAADSLHIVGELMKNFEYNRRHSIEIVDRFKKSNLKDWESFLNCLNPAIKTISLNSEISLITAYSNDVSYDMVFAQQVYGYGNSGDVLIILSTSGNSTSVVNAALTAKILNINVIAIVGDRNCKLYKSSDILIYNPLLSTASIQEQHIKIYHQICRGLEKRIFDVD
jgi:D-sedoheptulose 7-phosphate isomerase